MCNRLARSAVNRRVGGSSTPRSVLIVFCSDFDCMFVQTWICSKPFSSKVLFQVYRFRCFSVIEPWMLFFQQLLRSEGCEPRHRWLKCNQSDKILFVFIIRLTTCFSLILFASICLKQSVRCLSIVLPSCGGSCKSCCGASG